MAGVLGLAGPTAAADPLYPVPPQPAPVIQQVPGAAVAPAATPLGIPPMVPAVPTAPVAQAAAPLAASPTAPGVQSLAATAAVPQALVPATAGTLADFLKSKGATLQPQSARDFKALNIVLPVPRGWSQVPDPNVPDAFAVIADRVGGDGIYTSNAALVVYKLVGGDFDPKEAITHGFIDSQQLPAWRTTKATLGDFGGMPSAAIEGTYRENNMSLNTSRRHTIATAGPDKYLVTLSVTTTVGEAVAAADATDAITNGFRISPVGPPR
ncbi:hypothetical protein A5651_04345 [Mycobacterium sp. 1274761.0]|nr:hypothetical protein A5651_04345 [Mycobacterium sp. 1274761.0]